MLKFLIGTFFGAFVGISWMCLCNIVDDIDELTEYIMEIEAKKAEEEIPEEEEETYEY